MPRTGYKTVCVTDKVYRCIQEKAKQTSRSIPEYIDYLLQTENKKNDS